MAQDVQLKHSFKTIVHQHAELYPQWKIDDLYKMVFQAAMGSEHAVADPDLAVEYLESEADTQKSRQGTPLIMPLSPDNRLVRIGVGPFLSAGGDLNELARAFVQTSQIFTPSLDRLAKFWTWVEIITKHGELPFSLPELQEYIARRRRQGYPPVHHSSEYRRQYHPAYRVVLKELMVIPSK